MNEEAQGTMMTVLNGIGFELSLPVLVILAIALCGFMAGRFSKRGARDAVMVETPDGPQPVDALEDAFAEEINRQRREIASLRGELTRARTEADRLRRRGSNRAPSRVRVV
ncbi:MAG: hypothetical protein AAGK98_18545 [Pseudomonadota bacterium]